jgi:hypothetical protein
MSEAKAARKHATQTRPMRVRPRPLHNCKPELPDAYRKFIDCTPDYVAKFALGRTCARDPEYRKRKASKHGPGPVPVEGIAKRSR